ncbi:MAG: protein kinase [Candidatus Riflebacteria bacterium]|nr:protein kinase [Candidatus Riflebacteria bacterium]
MEPLSTIGKFLVLQELGHGGMGAVYIGYQSENRKLVVIKTLFEQWAKEENMVKRFLREAAVYKKLNHPNIVKFIDAGCDDGTHFIAMEYIRSRPLDDVLKKQGKLPVQAAVKIMGHLTDAVAHAHEKGIIHRDLKPQNIMFSEDGVVKLLDFGIAHTEDDLIKTQEGSVLGTFYYAAPEQNQGKRVDGRSDLYALGAILYEIVCGKRPIPGNTLLEVTRAQITGGIIAPTVHNPEVPKGLEKMIIKLLEKDPNNPYRNAKELIFDLQRFREDPKGFDPTRMFDDEEMTTKWEKAKEAYVKKNYDFALDLAKTVAQAKPDSAEIQVLLGKVYAAKNFKKPAMDAFKKALNREPESTQTLLDYGIALYSLREWDEAEATVKKVLELEPDNMYASRYIKLIADARNKPPAATGHGQGAGPAGQGRPPPRTTPDATGPKPDGAEAAAVPAQQPSPAGERAAALSRLWWGLGHLKCGRPFKFLFMSAVQIVVLGLMAAPVVRWPVVEVDFARWSVHVAQKSVRENLLKLHADKLDQRATELLNGPLRWGTLSFACLVFLLMEIKVPRAVRAACPPAEGQAPE